MNRQETINQLIKAALYAGSDVTLVQGGGGNVSVKSDDGKRMYIKASGYTLSEIKPDGGFVETDRYAAINALRNISTSGKSRSLIQDEFSSLIIKTAATDKLKPSIEAGFHAVLPGVVIHTHPVYINAFLCMKEGTEELKTITDCDFPNVGYYPPGYELATMVDKEYGKHNFESGGIYLQNHGFITFAQTTEEAVAIMNRTERTARGKLGEILPESPNPSAMMNSIALKLKARNDNYTIRICPAGFVTEAAFDENLAEAVMNPLVPDDVVYNYGRIFISDGQNFPDLPDKFILIVKNQGVITGAPTDRTIKNMEETLTAHIMIRKLISQRGKANELPQDEIDFITGMESEKFRASLK